MCYFHMYIQCVFLLFNLVIIIIYLWVHQQNKQTNNTQSITLITTKIVHETISESLMFCTWFFLILMIYSTNSTCKKELLYQQECMKLLKAMY